MSSPQVNTRGADVVFPWEEFVPLFVHPIKVAIVECMLWIDEPMSAKLIERSMNDGTSVSLISYHLRSLEDVGIVVDVLSEPVRGAVQTFFRLQPTSAFWSKGHR